MDTIFFSLMVLT